MLEQSRLRVRAAAVQDQKYGLVLTWYPQNPSVNCLKKERALYRKVEEPLGGEHSSTHLKASAHSRIEETEAPHATSFINA
jgi:hypothetical protein